MRSEATRAGEDIVGGQVLYMALELSERSWKVLFASPAGGRRERSVAARDLAKLLEETAAAKRRLGLPAHTRVVSCYEAGRDGFWLDRALKANGIDNLVVDSSSIEVAAAGATRQDRPCGPGQADGAVAALCGRGEEGVERGAGSRCGSRGRAAAVAVDRAAQSRARPACQPHQGAAGGAGIEAVADRWAWLGRARW